MVEAVQVTRYKAADGSLYDTVEEARRRDVKLLIQSAFTAELAYGQISALEATDLVLINLDRITQIMRPMDVAQEPTSVEPSLPTLFKGYSRQWLRCRTCQRVQFYDYLPFSLSNSVVTLACGHDSTERDLGCDSIDEATALSLLRKDT
jgi:hypothetical protein